MQKWGFGRGKKSDEAEEGQFEQELIDSPVPVEIHSFLLRVSHEWKLHKPHQCTDQYLIQGMVGVR